MALALQLRNKNTKEINQIGDQAIKKNWLVIRKPLLRLKCFPAHPKHEEKNE